MSKFIQPKKLNETGKTRKYENNIIHNIQPYNIHILLLIVRQSNMISVYKI